MLRMNKTCAVLLFSLCLSCFFSCFAMAHFFDTATAVVVFVLLPLIYWLHESVWFCCIWLQIHLICTHRSRYHFLAQRKSTYSGSNQSTHMFVCNFYAPLEFRWFRFILVGLPHWTCTHARTHKQIISSCLQVLLQLLLLFMCDTHHFGIRVTAAHTFMHLYMLLLHGVKHL